MIDSRPNWPTSAAVKLYCHCRMLKLATPYSYQRKIHLTHYTTDSYVLYANITNYTK